MRTDQKENRIKQSGLSLLVSLYEAARATLKDEFWISHQ